MRPIQRLSLLLAVPLFLLAACATEPPPDPIADLVETRKLDEALKAIEKIEPGSSYYAAAMVHKAYVHQIRDEYPEQIAAARAAIAADWRAVDGNAFQYLWVGTLRNLKDASEDARTEAKEAIFAEGMKLLHANPRDPLAHEIAAGAADLGGHPEEKKRILRDLFKKFPDSEEATDYTRNFWMETLFIGKEKGESGKDHAARRLAIVEEMLPILPRGFWRGRVIALKLRWIEEIDGRAASAAEAERLIVLEPRDPYLFFLASMEATANKEPKRAIKRAARAVRLASGALRFTRGPKRAEIKALQIRYLWRYATALEAGGNLEEAIEVSKQALERVKGIEGPVDTASALLYQFGLITPPNLVMAKAYEKLGQSDAAMRHYAIVAAESGARNSQAPEAQKALEGLYKKKFGSLKGLRAHFAKLAGKTVPTFRDATEAFGLKGVKASGGTFGDFNGDGFIDLSVAGRLYKNVGGKKFVDVSKQTGFSGGGIWVDLDNDGDLDNVSSGYRILYNDGKGKFTAATIAKPKGAAAAATSAVAALDYDGDGRLDLYFANMPPDIHGGHGLFPKKTPDHFYRNLGGGKFEEVSEKVGMMRRQTGWCGRGINCADYDNDGDTDIFVSNYSLHPNLLWRNNGKGRFTNVSYELNLDGKETEEYWGHTIGSVWGDIDNDGDLDLVTANLAHPRVIHVSDVTKVYKNLGGPDWKFEDFTKASGLRYDETHSDASLVDVDNDGDLDLYLTQIYPSRRTNLCLNDGTGRFEDVTWYANARHFNGWQTSWADIDNDGDMDLLVCSGEGVKLFLNDGNANHYLRVRAVGSDCNRSAVGARVTVTSGDRTQIREIVAGRGTGCQDELIAHFGLGKRAGTVTITVRFPCGKTVVKKNVKPDELLTIDEPK